MKGLILLRFETKKRHLVDILFVLSLFCIFAFSSVALIIFGSQIYKNTLKNMDYNFNARTCASYLTEKIRQADETDSIEIIQTETQTILMLYTQIDNLQYATALYEYNQHLYELFARTDIPLPLDAGQEIMEINRLDFTFIEPSILEISYTDMANISNTLYISTHSTDSEVTYE